MATSKKQQPQGNTLTIGGVVYVQPKMSVNTYMHYLEVRDGVMNTEDKKGLYTAKQFQDMMDCIVEVFGNQFTVEEMTDDEKGLTIEEIIFAFATVEIGITKSVNDKAEQMQENFQRGK